MIRDDVIQEIFDHYTKSPDFNGLPVYKMMNYEYRLLCELIDEGMVEVLSCNDVDNPHIRAFNVITPKEQQKEYVSDTSKHSVLYPTKKALASFSPDPTKPYSALMQKGEVHLRIMYFDIEILERYANNPKFVIMDIGYRGNIYVRDEYIDDDSLEGEYIKDYGMAYKDCPNLERAVGVFIWDLSKLSSQKQMLWKGFEIDSRVKCRINKGFVDNLIRGEWVDKVWIFHALIEEMKVINEQCHQMEIPELFNKTFGTHYSEMPQGYRNILLPTLKNYYDFVLVLEKMVVHNISIKTFQKGAMHIRSVERKDQSGTDKGSLVMFEEWLLLNIRGPEDLSDIIIRPLRNIRSIRQKPAHELNSNVYDELLHQKQHDLMKDTYTAIRGIRLSFANHPLAKTVKVPEHLVTGENIVNY